MNEIDWMCPFCCMDFSIELNAKWWIIDNELIMIMNLWMELTWVIIFPRVLLRSRWLAFLPSCWITRSRVVRYSSANSDTILQKPPGFVSRICCGAMPSHSRNLRNLNDNTEGLKLIDESTESKFSCCYRFITRRWTMVDTMILWAQSVKNSDILEHKFSSIKRNVGQYTAGHLREDNQMKLCNVTWFSCCCCHRVWR